MVIIHGMKLAILIRKFFFVGVCGQGVSHYAFGTYQQSSTLLGPKKETLVHRKAEKGAYFENENRILRLHDLNVGVCGDSWRNHLFVSTQPHQS